MGQRLRRTRIKVCGLTRHEDVEAAVEAGVDAVGFVLYRGSPRTISAEKAVNLAQSLPPFVTPVVVFSNAKVSEILLIQESIPNALFQFHGQEEPSWCESWGRPFIKTLRVKNEENFESMAQQYEAAQAVLLEMGTEQSTLPGHLNLNWDKIPKSLGGKAVLSGGLNVSNVKQAIIMVQPWAVNVGIGVEKSPGIKDHKAIQQFIKSVRVADTCIFDEY